MPHKRRNRDAPAPAQRSCDRMAKTIVANLARLAYSRRIMRFFLIVSVLSTILTAATAEAKPWMAIGAGATSSCGTWTAHRYTYQTHGAIQDVNNAVQEGAWVYGFLSGVGFAGLDGADPLRGVDGDAVLAWIDNYCRSNPLKKIAEAAMAFSLAHPH
jgi:hypothetical protein